MCRGLSGSQPAISALDTGSDSLPHGQGTTGVVALPLSSLDSAVFGYLDEIETGKSERFIQLDYYEKLKDQTMKFNGRIISFYDISYRSQPYEPNGCG
jgi:hypothetical protein